MQIRKAILIVLSAAAILCLLAVLLRLEPNKVVFARAQGSPGLEPYTPTRLEWLHLEAVALLAGSSSLPKDGYAIGPQTQSPDTIVLYGGYWPNVDRKAMNEAAEFDRMLIENVIKQHGWEGWAKVKVELVPIPNR
jgi:hypothetical protein